MCMVFAVPAQIMQLELHHIQAEASASKVRISVRNQVVGCDKYENQLHKFCTQLHAFYIPKAIIPVY